MNSLDTNILIYAVNAGCQEHAKAKKVYEEMLANPHEWILSDQVLFEFYRGLTNSRILERPLQHSQAMKQIQFLREDSGVLHCAYCTTFWENLNQSLMRRELKASSIFDHVLAITLLREGVTSFYTRNTKDFSKFGFKSLKNPIDI